MASERRVRRGLIKCSRLSALRCCPQSHHRFVWDRKNPDPSVDLSTIAHAIRTIADRWNSLRLAALLRKLVEQVSSRLKQLMAKVSVITTTATILRP